MLVLFDEMEKIMSLIIKMKTNVFYQTQAGGMACFQNKTEGVLVPLYNPMINLEDILFKNRGSSLGFSYFYTSSCF